MRYQHPTAWIGVIAAILVAALVNAVFILVQADAVVSTSLAADETNGYICDAASWRLLWSTPADPCHDAGPWRAVGLVRCTTPDGAVRRRPALWPSVGTHVAPRGRQAVEGDVEGPRSAV
jgi:hypothetical protein